MMSTALKCPNPSCPFLFDPSLVPVGAVLTCPRCGMRFTLGPQPGGNGAPPQDVPFETSNAIVNESSAERRSVPSSTSILMPLLCIFFVVGILIIGVALLRTTRTSSNFGGFIEFRDMNCSFQTTTDDWELNDNVKSEVKANMLGLARMAPEAKAAFHVSDYKSRNPQPGELREGILERLRSMFDDLDAEEQQDSSIWSGQKALHYRFRGLAKNSTQQFAGEAWSMGAHGIGYWCITWSSVKDADALLPEFAKIRDHLVILDYRKDWKETTSASVTFAGKEADYRLSDGDRWWKQEEGVDPKKFEDDAAADLLLTATFRTRQKIDNPPKATLTTVILPTSNNPLGALQAHLREKYARLYEVKKWQEITDAVVGDASPGPQEGLSDTLRFRTGEGNISRLVVLSAIAIPDTDKMVGVEAYCPWSDRVRWEKRLVQLAGSLRPGKAKAE